MTPNDEEDVFANADVDPGFEEWLNRARAEHIVAAEFADLLAVAPALTIRRAVAHARGCRRCLERLTSLIEELVLDEQDAALDSDGSTAPDRVDWTPLRRFLEHDESVLRAAGVRATVALSLDSPEVARRIASLRSDPDCLVVECATEAAARLPLVSAETRAVAAFRDSGGTTADAYLSPPLEIMPAAAAPADGSAASTSEDAEPQIWGDHSSPDGRLCLRVSPAPAGKIHVKCYSEHEELAGKIVVFEWVKDGEVRTFEVTLQPVLGQNRWQQTWIGRESDYRGFRLRIPNPHPV